MTRDLDLKYGLFVKILGLCGDTEEMPKRS